MKYAQIFATNSSIRVKYLQPQALVPKLMQRKWPQGLKSGHPTSMPELINIAIMNICDVDVTFLNDE